MDILTHISPVYVSMLAVLLPFVAFLLQAILGRKSISGNIALIAILLSTVLSGLVFFAVWKQPDLHERWAWFTIGRNTFYVGILLNNLTVLMQFLVCVIALPVHIYSRAYMQGDPGIHRYWMYLSLFCFAMLGLTISISLLQLYIFWELVGFASYLLIGYWFTRDAAVQANKKAFLINRIGDLGFLIGIALVYAHFGTLDLVTLFGGEGIFATGYTTDKQALMLDKNATWLSIAGIAFFLGAMAKSAQFPLHVWLPDAMEGPTSVSSLIHAATMVAAGVFLLCTVFPMFNSFVLLIIAIIGCITALSAALFALAQYDIKKILAFSTISQLGFMMVAVGIGAWDAAMFHLTTHAFFKCLLFLSAGAVIHEMAHFKEKAKLDIDPQDLRNMGGLRKYMPKTFTVMAIASLSLAGFPLTSGYLSKDSIVVSAFEWAQHFGGGYILVPVTMIIASLLTAFYIGRLIFKAFFGRFALENDPSLPHGLHEAPSAMLWPMIFLAACSFFVAFGWNPMDYHSTWLLYGFHVDAVAETLPLAHTLIPLLLTTGALIAWWIAWRWYVKGSYPLNPDNKLILFSTHQGYLNEVNNLVFVRSTEKLSQLCCAFDRFVVDGITEVFSTLTKELAVFAHGLDKYIVDGIVNFIAKLAYSIGHLTRKIQNGKLQSYIGFALAMVILGIIYLII